MTPPMEAFISISVFMINKYYHRWSTQISPALVSSPLRVTMPSSKSSLIALILPLLSSLLMGYFFTWGLQGILVVQVYNYYMSFPNDRWHWKFLIYFLFVVELAQTILATTDAYTVYAEGFGQFEALDNLHLLWLTLPVMSGLVGFVCHSTFAYRIYILSGLWQVGMFIFVLAAFAVASALTFSAKLFKAGTLSQLVHVDHIYLFCGLWNGSAALCDVAIAGCMTFFLLRSPRFKNTHFLITKIIRLTIETGIFTATASISSAVLFVGFRHDFSVNIYFVIPAILLAKLYSITIVATFNNRTHSVGARNAPSDSPAETTSLYEINSPIRTKFPRLDPSPSGQIKIGRSVVQQVWTDDVPMCDIETGRESKSSRDSNTPRMVF